MKPLIHAHIDINRKSFQDILSLKCLTWNIQSQMLLVDMLMKMKISFQVKVVRILVSQMLREILNRVYDDVSKYSMESKSKHDKEHNR